MKMKKTKLILMFTFVFCSCFLFKTENVEASEGEEYITIKVQASDDNEDLKYAIDTDDAAAFSDTNEFTIPAGTSHTIYVKDAAGNITSQTYSPGGDKTTIDDSGVGQEQQINIDLELGNNKEEDFSNYEYLTDDPVGIGTGTVNSKITTDGSDTAEKVFYTVSTDTGEIFYLVIDQAQSSNNVYLLNTVTLDDLGSLASDNNNSGSTKKDDEEDNLLAALSGKNEADDVTEENADASAKKGGVNKNRIIILVVIAIGGGAYYYFKVYKNKKNEMMDAMEAMDMEEFEVEEDEEEEVEFEVDDDEKERFLNQLIEEDDEETQLYDQEPDKYFEEQMQDNTYISDDDLLESGFSFNDMDDDEEIEEE